MSDEKGRAAVAVAVDDSGAGTAAAAADAAADAADAEVRSQQKRFLNARGRVRALKPMPVFDELALYEAFRVAGIKPVHAQSVWKGLLKGGAKRFDDIPNLPAAAYTVLNEQFAITTSRVKEAKTSANLKGATTKLIIELQDGQLVEAVVIRHEKQPKRAPGATAAMLSGVAQSAVPVPGGGGGAAAAAAANADDKQAPAAAAPASGRVLAGGVAGTSSSGVVDDDDDDDEPAAADAAATTAVATGSAGSGARAPNPRRQERQSVRRVTLCVSSQVGCAMACTFCATGTMGLRGNLWAGEICEQLYHANQYEPIRNVVYMGMGEPLNNYDNVLASIHLMSGSGYFGLSPSKITVSTVGVVPKIVQLNREAPGVNLALSLHAPNQALRAQIVPTARAWKLDVLMESIAHKRVLIEYILLGGINDSDATAHELGALLKGRDVVCNLIPYNTVELDDGRVYEAPTPERTLSFAAIVRTYGLVTTVRHEMGQEIGGACGQLAINGGKGCASDNKAGAAAGGGAAAAADAAAVATAACGVAAVTDRHTPTAVLLGATDGSAEAVKAAAAKAAAALAAVTANAPSRAVAGGGDIEDLGRTAALLAAAAGAAPEDVAQATAAGPVPTVQSVTARARKQKDAVAATAATIAERARKAAATAAAAESAAAAAAESKASSGSARITVAALAMVLVLLLAVAYRTLGLGAAGASAGAGAARR